MSKVKPPETPNHDEIIAGIDAMLRSRLPGFEASIGGKLEGVEAKLDGMISGMIRARVDTTLLSSYEGPRQYPSKKPIRRNTSTEQASPLPLRTAHSFGGREEPHDFERRGPAGRRSLSLLTDRE